MRAFRRALDDSHLQEIVLHGRRFTWSNGRDNPTLERIDRAFANADWFLRFPHHHLKSLASDSSDHAPLLLILNVEPWAVPRFHFELCWAKLDGFLEAVGVAWGQSSPLFDACKCLDRKLRAVARALRSWRATKLGSIQFQLAAARLIIQEYDITQESRSLSPGELALHRERKGHVLGLASLERTMARQRARTRHLREADACTKYFHLQACHRRRKNHLLTISHEGHSFSEEEAKAEVVYFYYNAIIGTPFLRRHRLNLDALQLPSLDLAELALPFSPAEVEAAVRASPSDRAPGPDGFGSAFLKVAWQVVGSDIVRVFVSLWDLDFRNFNCLNQAYMVLLHKNSNPLGLRDYRPISLIHTVGKLFAKTLALRLAPRMPALVSVNQTAFIKGRRIHENFRTVRLTCRWLHARRSPRVLLKVDLSKAFDTVAWSFLLEVLTRLGFPLRWRD